MPKIETYTAPPQRGFAQGPRATSDAFGSGAGFADVAQGLDAVARAAKDIQTRKDKVEYSRILSEFQLETMKREEELAKMPMPKGASYTSTALSDFEERYKKLPIPSGLKDEAAMDFHNMRLQVGQRAIRTEASREAAAFKLNYSESLNNLANTVALDPSKEEWALGQAARLAGSSPSASPEDVAALSNEARKLIRASSAEGYIRNGGAKKFIEDAQAGKWNDLDDVGRYVDGAAKQAEQDEINAARLSKVQLVQNHSLYMDTLNDPAVSNSEKMVKVNLAELRGEVSSDFAADFRRYINSVEKLSATTNDAVIADVIEKVYDLNASDMDEAEYLTGVENVRREIIQHRIEGRLSAKDEQKLNNQMRVLTGNRSAEATQNLASNYKAATETIFNTLPPEYKGQAVRAMFYATEGVENIDELKMKGLALKVVDQINTVRREKAVKAITTTKTPERSPTEIEAKLKAKGYTMQDVRDTAKKYGITEQEVINTVMSK